MNKNIILSMFAMLFLAGCAGVDLTEVSDEDLERISEKAVVCNDPYIRVGIECCLDENSNKICDRDDNGSENSDGHDGAEGSEFDEVLEDFDIEDEFEHEDDLGNLLDDETESEFNDIIEEDYEVWHNEIEKMEEELYELEEELENDESHDFEEFEFEAEGIEVEYDLEDGMIKIEWDELEDEDNFKYYKVLNSNDNPDVTYPETSAIFVGQDVDETEFEIQTKKLDKGVNYFRVGYVLENNEVFHTETVEVLIE
jgi:hypothetical protein